MVIHNATLTGSILMQAPPVISGSLTLTGSINATGDITASSARFSNIITAQTLVVQTVSSSVSYSSGSNVFGNNIANTQVFTGSVLITGSMKLNGAITGPLYINSTGSGANAQLDIIHGATQEGIAIRTLVSTRYSPIVIRDHLANAVFQFNEFGRLFATGSFMLGDPYAVEGTSVNAGTIAIFPSSSVSGGPLIQFSSNGRIRPGSTGDRLSIDGNALWLNSYLANNIIMVPNGGNVGIGTSSPSQVLHVYNTTNYVGALINGSNAPQVCFAPGTSTTPTWKVGISGNNGTSFSISSGTINADKLFISASGDVGIGTSTPGCRLDLIGGSMALNDNKLLIRFATDANHSLEFNSGYNGPFLYGYTGAALGYRGTGVVWTNNTNYYNYGNTTTWNTTSDRRIKQNINTLTNAINKISQLNPVSFDYIDNFASKRSWADKNKLNNVGFIAQEYENVFPDDVSEHEEKIGDITYEDFKNINVGSLTPYLVKAIQELKAEIDELKNK